MVARSWLCHLPPSDRSQGKPSKLFYSEGDFLGDGWGVCVGGVAGGWTLGERIEGRGSGAEDNGKAAGRLHISSSFLSEFQVLNMDS